ncbi:MAG TPA: cysteine synthase family protein [Edaphobacter sp.]|nr:cysteine synthase family protein [Edaphobacter sp.]
MNISSSAIDVIGDTPLVDLSRFAKGLGGRLLAKLEYLNPGGSKKDRVARQIIEDAEIDGTLERGQSVVELTSGNTGTGLAIVCAVKGYPFIAVMSKGNSQERMRMMRALGAEVVLVDQREGSVEGQVSGGDLELVDAETNRIVAERGAFRADQFHHRGNFRAHYLHTGREILNQTEGRIDAFCDFAGSGGTFAGCAAAFKEYDPRIQCYVVEPSGSTVLASGHVTQPGHRIQGGGYSMPVLPLINTEHIDGYLSVTDEEAIDAARALAKLEGIFAGFSSGANIAAARQLIAGRTVVVTINDSGLKYLSTDLWR